MLESPPKKNRKQKKAYKKTLKIFFCLLLNQFEYFKIGQHNIDNIQISFLFPVVVVMCTSLGIRRRYITV